MLTEEDNPRSAAKEPLPKAYDPLAIEEKWARKWVEEKLFHVDTPAPGDKKNPFTILLPPPNVTGRLHMGHMFEQTETDILIRWHRMRGDLAMWVPGTDHAGIATQMLVERQLATENLSREGMGRDAFVERVWQWKQLYGSAITDQMKRLGASVDWQREYFTMDERLSVAVREAFVRLHEQGLIYRGAYIVNWCPRCQTALSDLEVVHEEHAGKLWHIRYATADGSGSIVIATTRPETMLGDVAVAVNPNDERYRALHGKMLRLPLLGREIPLVLDDWANPEFGTGAVKVTPAHDPNDFAIGQRHNLPSINVMDTRGLINENGGPYAGLDRYAARKKILADLEEQGLLVAAKDHTYALGRCDRCKTVVEPRLSTQWFLAVNKVATGEHAPGDGLTLQQRAIAAVEQGHVKIGPEQHRKVYLDWMGNLHDWCISRQLWWGHRIPAWHCAGCGKMTVARETPAACAHCGSANLQQETDVLDTWFSSGLLPFTVFGWPQQTPDLSAFYPTQLLVTGFDILFFWVARMIMLGTHFMVTEPLSESREEELTFLQDQVEMEHLGGARPLRLAVPFQEVHIHALVRDADRQKMSKTKGNVIDPIEIITRYGTDAVRFTLATMASPGTDIAFSEARTEGYRAFANKIWNAARFIFMQRERAREAGVYLQTKQLQAGGLPEEFPNPEDGWILTRLSQTNTAVSIALTDFRFDEAANEIYQFFWNDFCDWYLELSKTHFRFDEESARAASSGKLNLLLSIFESALRLLSPFMPFITEEIWQALWDSDKPSPSIALAKYPGLIYESESDTRVVNTLKMLVIAARSQRKEQGVPEKRGVPIEIFSERTTILEPITKNPYFMEQMAKISEVRISETPLTDPLARAHSGFQLKVDYQAPMNIDAEKNRLNREIAKLQVEWDGRMQKLANESFLAKAPQALVEQLRDQNVETGKLLEKNRAALAALDGNRS